MARSCDHFLWLAFCGFATVERPLASWLGGIVDGSLSKKGNVTMSNERLLVSKKDLKALGIPYCAQHIARLEAAGLFPQRIKLGACRVAWRYKDVLNWIEARVLATHGNV
jgi:prophage regulatory protein